MNVTCGGSSVLVYSWRILMDSVIQRAWFIGTVISLSKYESTYPSCKAFWSLLKSDKTSSGISRRFASTALNLARGSRNCSTDIPRNEGYVDSDLLKEKTGPIKHAPLAHIIRQNSRTVYQNRGFSTWTGLCPFMVPNQVPFPLHC